MSNPLVFVRYCFKIQEMRIRVGKADPWQLGDVPDPFQTQKIRDDTVSEDLYSLQYVLDWFVVETIVKHGMMKMLITTMMSVLSGTVTKINAKPRGQK